ncbi:methyl-accepting chemotaxis protein [Sphaerotilus sulfidivorans]|uniref:HAMP domain-containing protein n=1 Tax=Sphaerotilus sulfidivorans TaxID=639200 RepID=A0A5C1Q1E4_9BURK|nr:methyl-accepting chemotaxis protein [Sphaerotilus sulfidivorans]NZD45373.1 MCP four helix bundle domain-containing protein [Sphaerotilus sulfidivorans]QEN00759.1 HAMP domain-containing protein [Sphaerotilus sulfidivorans]
MALWPAPGVTRRQYLFSMLTVTLMAGTAGFSYWKLGEANDIARRTEAVRTAQLREIAQIELYVTQSSLQLRHGMLARNADERQAAIDDILKRRQLIEQSTASYESKLFSEQGRQRFSSIPGLMKAFWTHGEGNLELVRQGRREEAFAYLVDHTIPARNALLAALQDNVGYQDAALKNEIEQINQAVNQTLTVLLAILALLAAGMLWNMVQLGRTMSRRVEESTRIAERVRDGDLATPVTDREHDEFSPLLRALQEMQASLTQIVSGVRGSAETVAQASNQIAEGNNDLSRRTEDQASALQQTAATMDELSNTVRTNTGHAQEATRLAQDAVQIATGGGTLMRDVVQTMDGISESSRKIGDIIGVIDSIAFQTNILALNAAVEAARAGEQGRGFAVVASEVRNLAQRSAEAAREIKNLISTSVGRVEQGSALVGRAGATMEDIVRSIERVSSIVADISDASQDQNAAIEQVGQAITQMDRSTQQNAALVEESAAAAQDMREQAGGLLQAVASFRTPA